MTPKSLRATRTVVGRCAEGAADHRSAAMVVGGGRWAKRLLQTAVATGAVGALLPVLVPSATPQIKRMLLMSRGSTEQPSTAATAGTLSALQLQPVDPRAVTPKPLLLDELVSIGSLWQDQTLVLHVMRRFG